MSYPLGEQAAVGTLIGLLWEMHSHIETVIEDLEPVVPVGAALADAIAGDQDKLRCANTALSDLIDQVIAHRHNQSVVAKIVVDNFGPNEQSPKPVLQEPRNHLQVELFRAIRVTEVELEAHLWSLERCFQIARSWAGKLLDREEPQAIDPQIRVTATCARLTSWAARLLPRAERADYQELFQAELFEIAETGSWRTQLSYAVRVLLHAVALRRELQKAPTRAGERVW
ncbi:hypothetical protein JOD54_005111 [Actinokineospora baliensis]|uniref:hypothetical protein n=1 Tax=Actinokineospora baliensis TaxID=547056 RepID=UPI00195D2902|nr:hypothetical protein [Actinokineospora baliensis]MBM7774907.1 hypothetical protein [Actinokineospora baliensis]